jgi:cyanobactin maturation PatA/PatG family protease
LEATRPSESALHTEPRFGAWKGLGAGELMSCPLPGLEQVWRHTLGNPRVSIAVLDGPVDVSHPSLSGALLTSPRAIGRACGAGTGSCAHGTHVASLIFAQHGGGPLKGVAPGCRGIVIPIFSDHPAMPGAIRPCAQSELARAIEAAVGYGAHVINISGGQPGHAGTADPRLVRAVELCARRGVLVVAAAGNDGCDCLHLPAALPTVLTVGAHGRDGAPSESSNFGRAYLRQGVVAPGESLLGAVPGGKFERRSGTSFAVPLVAGLAGLLLSARAARKGHLAASDRRDLRDALLHSVLPCDLENQRDCQRLLAGRIDAVRAFELYVKGAIDMNELVHSAASPLPRAAIAEAELTEGVGPACASTSGCSCGCGTPSPAPPTAEDDAYEDDENVAASGSRPLAVPARPLARRATRGLSPSECSCQKGGGLVYALGELGYDFGTQARLDAINAEMDEGKFPTNPRDLLEFLTVSGNHHFAAAILWTLNHDASAIYALRPEGPFARDTYGRLLEYFADQIDGRAERVSIPGVLDGSVSLLTGQQVPVLVPELRGMYNWTTEELVVAVTGRKPGAEGQKKDWEVKAESLRNFLERIYYEVRNTGQTPQERALNFAATNAFNLEKVFESAAKKKLQLDEIGVDPSPLCRPDSDCWDVRLIFFDPEDALGHARTAYRFSVDVSDVVPVLVGPVRSWAMR